MPPCAPDMPTTSLPGHIQGLIEDRLDSGVIELPMLPQVTWKLMQMGASDEVDSAALTRLINQDQVLAGHILRVANSPVYKGYMPIVTLPQAISRLGIDLLYEIVLTVSLQTRLFSVPGHNTLVRALWQHALGTALYAHKIAHLLRQCTDSAFLCGLLHDIGKPVLLQMLVDLQRTSKDRLKLSPELISTAVEMYHTQAGTLLAAQWDLPSLISTGISYHHDYTAAPEHTELVLLIHLADLMTYYMLSPNTTQEHELINLEPWAALGCTAADVTMLLRKRPEIMQVIAAMAV